MDTPVFPYPARLGDRWSSDEPYHYGEPTELIELPLSCDLDENVPDLDVAHWRAGHASPSVTLEVWQGDFDFAYRDCRGGVYTMALHPELVGRGHRVLMLERLLDHITAHDGVAFSRVSDYVAAWSTAGRPSPRTFLPAARR